MEKKNWKRVPLGEIIAEAQSGFASGKRDENGVIQLRMNNVDTRGAFVWNEVLRVPAFAEAIDFYALKDGDVLFNNTNSTELVGKSALFTGYPEPVVFSNHFTRLRTKKEKLDPCYLANWLLFQWQSKVFERICNQWIGQSAVKNDKLFDLEIPLPPLSEQIALAARLRAQLEQVARARAAAQEQLDAIDALPQSLLRQAFNS